jgi:hypothetical protein
MEEDLLKMSGVSAGSIAILLLIYRILKTVKGKRFISVCCQRKMDVGFDVKEMETPKLQNNPMVVVDGITRTHHSERKQTDGQTIQTLEV